MVWRRNGANVYVQEATEGMENAVDVARTEDVSSAKSFRCLLIYLLQ
jgi:hypothetical protein